ncbi:MAG TPA: SpvB/TcaC N-terminal domain-containing protein, partial [Flavilitoribacter sp.]|nr:SpvB/TcaC N-terminal domain-containing protein [Flavilitoribacter sp.]
MLDSHTIKNNAPFSQLTQERATQSNAIDIPSITLPKGGGALKGIDEKFEVNAANGTAGFSIPLPITPGRNNFAPALALSYNSGAGNSAFGLGWSLGYPMIQRRTDKRLPRYRDGRIEDVFMFSGAEDLVPYLENKDGSWEEIAYPENGNEGYAVKRYRPRVEGAFARIEKIHHPDHGTYWKVTTRDNTVTLFGRSKTARIANPEEETQIFQWLPEFSYDDKGNWIKFEYKPEDLTNVPDALFEKNRKTNLAPISNRYLKKVRYGNRRPYYADASKPYDPQAPADQEYLFELLLDYGEHDLLQPSPREMADGWSYRADAFSSYRAGFEIRTHRLCKRILMFHHFKEEDQFEGTPAETPFGENYLVRSLDLAYAPSSINGSGQAETTYLKAVTQSGYIRKSDGTYSKRSLPPLEFTYEQLHWNQTIKTISPENIANAPVGLTNQYQWVDLYNEGIAGILSEQADGWFYKSNLGGSAETGKVAFTAAQKVAPKPSFTGLSNGVMTVQDLAANGEKQIVINSDALKGYYELSKDNHWQPFQPFSQVAHIDLQNPNTRLIDLDGDGQADIFISEDSVFTWYASDGKRGHLPAEKVVRALDEERGPAMIFTDPVQSLFLADLSGDGLTDIVRIRNGEICYWANKGYGKFSAKINMANAPLFDHPDQFNPQYLQLADVSGTGASDLIYLGQNKFKAYINLSGNAWSDAHEIEPFFPIDRNTQLSVVDLLGTGTSCIVWSSDLPAYAHAPMRYIDLMDSKKPHLLVHCKNNLGKETFIEYKSSTHYYLKDKLDRKPWITKLPFPVQVISKMVVEEKITNVRFASEYHYHHGYYDHAEREFRGFGMVEQLDTEFYAVWKKNHNDTRLEPSEDLYQAPTLTKTWFHTGAFLDRERILTQFEKEYWYEIYQQRFPGEPLSVREPRLADARVVSARNLDFDINDLTSEEWREALRACKGMMLRQEVFTLDATEGDPASLRRQAKPYTVATHNCHIQVLQARSGNPYAVFMPTESEAITIAYERNEQDPRIAHSLNLKVDELGQVLEAASVVYPRQFRPDNHPIAALRDELATLSYERSGEQEAYLAGLNYLQAEQEKTLITFTQNAFTQDLEAPGLYRLRLPAATQTYEITGLTPSGVLFQLEDFAAPNGAGQRRLIEHIQTSYYNDSLRAELPQGELGRYGIPYQSYQLAYTPELLARIFGDKLPQDPIALENLLSDNDQNADGDNSYAQCRFVHRQDDNWWIRSGTAQFYLQDTESLPDVQNRFFSPQSFLDPFGSQTRVTYYKDYYLLMESATDALGNQSGVERFNFRTLSPVRMRDINDNLSEVLLDELGLVKAMALLGKGDEADNLNGLSEITSEAERAQIKTYFTLENTDALRTQARVLLQNAGARFVYDFERYQLSVQLREEQTQALPCEVVKLLPAVVGSITREQHFPQNPDSPLQLAFEYSDGMGHVAMAKAQAEPGEALTLRIAPDCSYQLDTVNTGENLRWIGNGRTVLNNKGNPVKQYEPYFSVNPFYEDAKELVERGVSPIIYYDALGRNIKTLLPDGTFSRVEFDSWQQRTFDPNDTVLDSDWYKDRIERRIDAQLLADGKDPLKEKAAAEKTAWHHNTPGRLYLDTLGRPVLSVGHNRVYERNAFGAITGARDELYSTLVELDIEGNTRKVIDAKGNAVMQYAYDLLGHRVYQNSMDAGEKWMLQNLAGNPIRHWDSKGHIFSTRYDILQRPTEIRLQTTGANAGSLIQKMVYGEGLADAKAKNLRGKAWQTYDSSGRITAAAFDFKGNILTVKRQLAAAYDAEIIDWSDGAPTNRLDRETFTQSTEYDALNRMQRLFNWHRSEDRVTVYLPTYNARGVLDSEIHISDADKAALETTGRRVTAVSQLEYNEKGQRTRMRYGNGSHTRYHYDRENFRLLQLKTTRSGVNGSLPAAPSNLSDANVLQNLYYTYDAVGNISEIEDDAFEPVFFRNQRVEPRSRYTYDALYRLEEATGRENKNFNSAPQAKEPKAEAAGFPLTSLAETDKTLRNYTQRYRYDATGNILHLRHLANGGPWTR